MEEFRSFQIAASEALRAGCDLEITTEERVVLFRQAAHFAAKAFLSSNDNVYYRLLAITQYQCAFALILLSETGYRSDDVQHDVDPDKLYIDVNTLLSETYPIADQGVEGL